MILSVTTLLAILLGAATGALFTSFGLIEFHPRLYFGGGNEWTPLVTGGGATIGAALGASAWFRKHWTTVLGAALGMLVAILIRDEYMLQPPVVFLDLFGLPLFAAGVGYFFEPKWAASRR